MKDNRERVQAVLKGLLLLGCTAMWIAAIIFAATK